MTTIAFGLRAEYDGTVTHDDGSEAPVYTGGVIAVGLNREALDVRRALDDGAGRIVVDDSDLELVGALDAYPALKRLPADADAAGAVQVSRYELMTANDLKAEFDSRGFETAGRASKADRAAALQAHDHALAAGDTETAAQIAAGTIDTAAGDGQED